MLPGCSESPAITVFGEVFQEESVRYQVRDSANEPVGNLFVELVWTGSQALVSAEIDYETMAEGAAWPPAGRFAEFAWTDYGQITGINTSRSWLRPLGLEAHMVVPYLSPLYYNSQFASQIVPIGPQLLMAGRPPGPWYVALPGFSASGNLERTGWNLTARGPCPAQCTNSLAPESRLYLIEEWVMNMAGPDGAVLPDWATWTAVGFSENATVSLQAVERDGQGQKRLVPTVPRALASPQTEPWCGYAPCEPPGWPADLSLQLGLEALQGSSEWTAFSADGAIIENLALQRNLSLTSDLTPSPARLLRWAFLAQSPDDEATIFEVEARYVPGTQLMTAPAVTAVTPIPIKTRPAEFPEIELVSLPMALAAIEGERGLDLGKVRTIVLNLDDAPTVPELSLRYRYGFSSDISPEGEQDSASVSALFGRIWYTHHRGGA